MTREQAADNHFKPLHPSWNKEVYRKFFLAGWDAAGASMMVEHLDAFINWWHRDYRFYPGYGFMLKSDGRKPFIEVEYFTTAQLFEEYLQSQIKG